jgi:adenylate cyclase
LRPLYYHHKGLILGYSGKYEQAIQMNKKVLEINPAAQRAYGIIGRFNLLLGNLDEALDAISNEPWEHFREYNMAFYYHAAGKKKEADVALFNFIEKYQKEWPYSIATIYAFRNEKDKSIEWLEKAIAKKDTYLINIKVDPLLKNLFSDPRYISILKRLNLK